MGGVCVCLCVWGVCECVCVCVQLYVGGEGEVCKLVYKLNHNIVSNGSKLQLDVYV